MSNVGEYDLLGKLYAYSKNTVTSQNVLEFLF